MYSVGDIVYVVRDKRNSDTMENQFRDKVVDKIEVEYILRDKEGDHILINTWDGYVKINEYMSCKIFKTVEETSNYLETILDS